MNQTAYAIKEHDDLIEADRLRHYSVDTYEGSIEIQAYTFGQALRLAEESHDVLAICEVE